MQSLLAQSGTFDVSTAKIAGAIIVGYCLISVCILWAYARTRWYPLYVLKSFWIGVTIVGFIWIVSMSCADPGSKHGGVTSEFMRNPAGPFAAVGDYVPAARAMYASSPW
ncbi:hypothetical protein LCGC14_2062370, partial [marine sediment metagenome]